MALDIGWAVMAEGLEGNVYSIYFIFQWLKESEAKREKKHRPELGLE